LASVLTQRRRKTWRIVRRIQTKCFALNNQKVNKSLLPAKRISHLALKKQCDCSVHDRKKSKFGNRDYRDL